MRSYGKTRSRECYTTLVMARYTLQKLLDKAYGAKLSKRLQYDIEKMQRNLPNEFELAELANACPHLLDNDHDL